MRSCTISRLLATMSRQLSCRYTVDGQPQSSLLLLAPEALLPVLAFHASLRARYLLGRDIGVDIRPDSSALLGMYADVPPVRDDPQSVIRALFFVDALKKVFGVHDGEGGRWINVECLPVYEHYKNGFLPPEEVSQDSQEGPQWPLAIVTSQR
jgi:hypothetical protein